MKVVASAELGGLGPKEGAPVFYDWHPPSPLPRFLPWLALFVLLILKPNRTGKAWWILVPMACVAAASTLASSCLDFIPSEVLDIFGVAFSSLGFGIAAVWLLAPYLGHRLRFLGFLKMLGVVFGMTAFCYLVRQDWAQPELAAGFLVFVGIAVLVAVVALNLAGLVCRRQYRPFGLTLWLALFIAALWTVIAAPFFIIAAVSSRGEAPWGEFVQAILAFIGLTFGMILPFLLLAFANGLFRERLQRLLHLGEAASPPVIAPPPPLPVVSPAT